MTCTDCEGEMKDCSYEEASKGKEHTRPGEETT